MLHRWKNPGGGGMSDELKTYDKEIENCPECGCGFFVKYDDGLRICLYCPCKWKVINENDAN